jgi:hypothetical protein
MSTTTPASEREAERLSPYLRALDTEPLRDKPSTASTLRLIDSALFRNGEEGIDQQMRAAFRLLEIGDGNPEPPEEFQRVMYALCRLIGLLNDAEYCEYNRDANGLTIRHALETSEQAEALTELIGEWFDSLRNARS